MASAGAINYAHLGIYLDETFQILCTTTLNAYELEGGTFYDMFNHFFEHNPLINNDELFHKLRHLPYSPEDIKTIIKFLIMKMINPPILDDGTIRMNEVEKYIPNVINLMIEVIFFLPEILNYKSSLDLLLAFFNEIVYAFSINTIEQYTRETDPIKRIRLPHIYMMEWFKSQLVEMMGVEHKPNFFKINLPFSGDIYDSECLQLFDVKTTIHGCKSKLTQLKTKYTKVRIWANHPSIDGYYFIHSCTDTYVQICFTKSNVSPVKIADGYTYSFRDLDSQLRLFITHLMILQRKSREMRVLNNLNDECGRNDILNILRIFSKANEDESYFINIKRGLQNISIPKEVKVEVDNSILQCETIPFVPMKQVNREDEGEAAEEPLDEGAAAEEPLDEGTAVDLLINFLEQLYGEGVYPVLGFIQLKYYGNGIEQLTEKYGDAIDEIQKWLDINYNDNADAVLGTLQQNYDDIDSVLRPLFNRYGEQFFSILESQILAAQSQWQPSQQSQPQQWQGAYAQQSQQWQGAYAQQPQEWQGAYAQQRRHPQQPQQYNSQGREICKFYLQGRCKHGVNGEGCTYSHDANEKYFYDRYIKYKIKYIKLKENIN
jgi:hypothetical protein